MRISGIIELRFVASQYATNKMLICKFVGSRYPTNKMTVCKFLSPLKEGLI